MYPCKGHYGRREKQMMDQQLEHAELLAEHTALVVRVTDSAAGAGR